MKSDALQHQHRRVGQVHAALDQAARRIDAAEQDGDRDDRQRVVPGEEGDEDAGVAVARGDSEALALPCTAATSIMPASPAKAPPQRGEADDQRADGQALHLRGAHVAAGDAGAKPQRVFSISTQERMQATTPTTRPQCTSVPGMLPMRKLVGQRLGRRLVEGGRIAQRPLDQMVHQRDGDIGHQQAGDRLVDARGSGAARRPRRSRRRRRPCRPAPSAGTAERTVAPPGQRQPSAAAATPPSTMRALAADDDEAEPRRQRHAQRGEQQRRGARQRVLHREPAAEAAAPHAGRRTARRLAERHEAG